ncbi:MAG: SWIM zinc finger family protein [Candidatus Lokiarchaeota archaeon]|nr:SWIM zinc finger family protein [Candidatus Lokiarchaeota archaeon]
MSKDLLFEMQTLIVKKGIIDDEIINFINTNFAINFEKVLESFSRGVIKNIYKPSERISWIVKGEKKNKHLVYPKLYCSCQEFYKNVVINRKRNYCKHIIAQILSESLGEYNIKELEDKRYYIMIKELESKF